ncbi:MAG: hypothetical protein Q8R16_03145, partial [bacterium]|nr:hypothetical protein [bacterium]
MNFRTTTLGLLLALTLMGAGCITFKGSAKADGGLFASSDRGDTWAQKSAIPAVGGQRRSLSGTNIRTFTQDPQDAKAFYAGTDTEGAYYSWDGGEAWWALGSPFAQAQVDAIVVHPKEKCSLFVAAGKKVF